MNLRFTLNEVFVCNDMPDGWRELTLNIKRNDKDNAIYIDYTSELTFWGDAFKYLKNFLDTLGVCAKIPVKIEIDRRDKNQFKLLYMGVVDLADCKDDDINLEKRTIRCRLKSPSYLDYISAHYDWGVWYFNHHTEQGVQTTFDGTPVDTVNFAKYIVLHDIVTGDQPGNGATFPEISYAYKVSDVLKYHFEYMTGNKVSAISDLFTQQSFQKGIINIGFSDPFTEGDSIDIQFTNCFGRIVQKTVVMPAGSQAVKYDYLSKAFLQEGDFSRIIGNSGTPATADQKAKCAYAFYDGSMFSWSQGPYQGNEIVRLEHLTPITDLTVTWPSHDVEIDVINELTYGMKNMFMAFNFELTFANQMGNKILTYKKLFEALDSHFDLGMALEPVGDAFTMRIEPKEYFFNKPQIINIGSPTNITASANTDLLIQNLAVGTKGANSNAVKGASGKKQLWNVRGCAVEISDKDSEFNFDISSIGEQDPNFPEEYPKRYPDDIAFVMSTAESTEDGNTIEIPVYSEKYRVRVINSMNPPDILNGATEGLIYSYNAGLINFWAVYNHLFSLAGSPQSPSNNDILPGYYTVRNTDSAFARKNYEFDALLTDDETKITMIQPIGRIGFKDNESKQRSVSLYELEWNINTFKAHLKVFV